MTRTVALLLLAMFLAPGCSSGLDLSRAETQLEVGVRAARGNLWREATFRFQRATEMAPDDAEAFNNLAVAYEGIGEFDKAREAYLKALQLDRANEYIQKNYSRYVEFASRNKKRQVPGVAEKSTTGASAPAGAAPSGVAPAPIEPSPAPPAAAPAEPPASVPPTAEPEPPAAEPPPVEKPSGEDGGER